MDNELLKNYDSLVESVYEISDDPRTQLDVFHKLQKLMDLQGQRLASGSASHAERVDNEIIEIESKLNNL